MNTSHIRSGCCWFPLMKPITLRPLAPSITSADAHDLLELHALLDHRPAAPSLQQGLLNPRETSAQNAHNQIVVVVGLRTGRPMPVELFQQPHKPLRDGRENITTGSLVALDLLLAHRSLNCVREVPTPMLRRSAGSELYQAHVWLSSNGGRMVQSTPKTGCETGCACF
jgi:hypothetical protein